MLLTRDLPSILQFAEELSSTLDQRELVVLGCPSCANWQPWTESILDALDGLALRRDASQSVRLPTLKGDIDNPRTALGIALGRSEDSTVVELLETYGPETVVVLTVSCSHGISDGWKKLFSHIGRAYRLGTGRGGPVLALLTDCQTFPPIEPGVGIRVRALWNAVRWEEIRLLADSMLPENENALVRAWRIAVYSAASTFDPEMVFMLCQNMPNSLAEAVKMVVERKGSGAKSDIMPRSLFVPDRRWDVPPSVVPDWANGRVNGITLERGASLNIESLKKEEASSYILTAIWREQVAGLLAVIMEMGFSIAQTVTNAVGEQWLRELPNQARSPDGRVNLEPAEILEKLKGPPKTRVPKSLWHTLHLLKDTRNDLAHMRPVNYGRVRELWQRYDQARLLFGTSPVARECRAP